MFLPVQVLLALFILSFYSCVDPKENTTTQNKVSSLDSDGDFITDEVEESQGTNPLMADIPQVTLNFIEVMKHQWPDTSGPKKTHTLYFKQYNIPYDDTLYKLYPHVLPKNKSKDIVFNWDGPQEIFQSIHIHQPNDKSKVEKEGENFNMQFTLQLEYDLHKQVEYIKDVEYHYEIQKMEEQSPFFRSPEFVIKESIVQKNSEIKTPLMVKDVNNNWPNLDYPQHFLLSLPVKNFKIKLKNVSHYITYREYLKKVNKHSRRYVVITPTTYRNFYISQKVSLENAIKMIDPQVIFHPQEKLALNSFLGKKSYFSFEEPIKNLTMQNLDHGSWKLVQNENTTYLIYMKLNDVLKLKKVSEEYTLQVESNKEALLGELNPLDKVTLLLKVTKKEQKFFRSYSSQSTWGDCNDNFPDRFGVLFRHDQKDCSKRGCTAQYLYAKRIDTVITDLDEILKLPYLSFKIGEHEIPHLSLLTKIEPHDESADYHFAASFYVDPLWNTQKTPLNIYVDKIIHEPANHPTGYAGDDCNKKYTSKFSKSTSTAPHDTLYSIEVKMTKNDYSTQVEE